MQNHKDDDVVSQAQERLLFLKEKRAVADKHIRPLARHLKRSVARLAGKGFNLSVVDDPQGLETLSPLDEHRKVHTFQQRHYLQFDDTRFFTVDFRFRPYMRDARDGEVTIFMTQKTDDGGYEPFFKRTAFSDMALGLPKELDKQLGKAAAWLVHHEDPQAEPIYPMRKKRFRLKMW